MYIHIFLNMSNSCKLSRSVLLGIINKDSIPITAKMAHFTTQHSFIMFKFLFVIAGYSRFTLALPSRC